MHKSKSKKALTFATAALVRQRDLAKPVATRAGTVPEYEPLLADFVRAGAAQWVREARSVLPQSDLVATRRLDFLNAQPREVLVGVVVERRCACRVGLLAGRHEDHHSLARTRQ
jgi:hypothetical protein